MRSPLAPFVALLANLLLVFGLYIVARIEYLFENYNYFSAVISPSRLWNVFYGGYMFDRSAIVYTNALYIVMMLFPLWLKETPLYHKLCKWVFVVVNSLTLIINLGDSVYFPYTLRRTTMGVFNEFKNENNLVLGRTFSALVLGVTGRRINFHDVEVIRNATSVLFSICYQ